MNKFVNTNTKKAYFSKDFNYIFDKQDGQTIMWGESYRDDPEVSPFNVIVDFEITEKCSGIGNYGPCKFCYKSNNPYSGYVTSLEEAKTIIDKLPRECTQIAFGTDAKLETNPYWYNIFKYARERGFIPNVTVADLTSEKARQVMSVCGAVAVSRYHDKEICYDTISNLINEAFRIVRTNIDLLGLPEGKGKVFIFSSFYPGSGKTFVTMNLALSMAFRGKKIIAVDMDLRKASLSRYVGSPKKGVASYLNGHEQSWQALLVKESINSNMDVLPVGTLPPNPAELLVNGRFDQLLEELKAEYDYIFIDSTPLEMIADTALVVRHADLNFFVMRAELFERRYLSEVEKLYREKRLPNMVLLLNGVLRSGSHYGYAHYGYGYGYGYGSEKGYGF